MLFKMFLQVLKGRNIKGIDKVAGQSHVFEMQTGSERKMYGGSESEVNSWVSDINKNLPVDNSSATPLCNRAPLTDICNNTVPTVLQPDQEMTTYTVVLGKCPEENSNTALCLEKQYKLCLDTHEMVLIQAQGPSHQQLVKWPYRYIRRYGRSTHRFTFEAGRKCESGEGLFEFEVEDGEEVFADVSNRTRAMKKHRKQGSEGSIPHLETNPPSSGTSSSRALPATPTSPLQPPIPERKYGTDTINEIKLQQMKRNGTSPPTTPDKTHPNKVVQTIHAIKEQTKHVFEHFTDSLHHTHNNEKKLKNSSEDVRKRNSGLTVESEVLGTTGKYSPNMQHRSLPAIPKDAPTQPPIKNTHEYALYDDTYNRRGVTPSGGDLYEGDQPSSYMMAQSSLSDYKPTDLYDDDQEHYSSIEEQDRLKLLNKNTMNSVQSEMGNTTQTFKMSSVLAETRQANENSAATDQDYDDVDGMIPTEETYSYTYAGEYEIVDFRKDLEMKSVGTDTPFFSSATDGDNVYGSVSLNHANSQSDSPSYINTSHMKSLKS